jgi:hypothetical protein
MVSRPLKNYKKELISPHRYIKKPATPPAMRGPTGLPLKKIIPRIEPIMRPMIIWGCVSNRFIPRPFNLVAMIPPEIANTPGKELNAFMISLGSILSKSRIKGTRIANIKNNNPVSRPWFSNNNKKLLIFNNLRSRISPAAIKKGHDLETNPRKKIRKRMVKDPCIGIPWYSKT